jgi:hypothetical protein
MSNPINWDDEFVESAFYDALSEAQKESAGFTVNSFINYMSDYVCESPKDWNKSHVQSVCLEWIPKKVTAEIEFFEHFGDVLIQFFNFLDEKQYIKNAKTLQKAVEEIKNRIPIVASNPNNWGMAKSMMMGARQSGYDINNEGDINNYMMNYREQALSRVLENKPVKENLYKKIGRNDKISVKYSDGTLKENVKFKVVEQDLLNDKCELIK